MFAICFPGEDDWAGLGICFFGNATAVDGLEAEVLGIRKRMLAEPNEHLQPSLDAAVRALFASKFETFVGGLERAHEALLWMCFSEFGLAFRNLNLLMDIPAWQRPEWESAHGMKIDLASMAAGHELDERERREWAGSTEGRLLQAVDDLRELIRVATGQEWHQIQTE